MRYKISMEKEKSYMPTLKDIFKICCIAVVGDFKFIYSTLWTEKMQANKCKGYNLSR